MAGTGFYRSASVFPYQCHSPISVSFSHCLMFVSFKCHIFHLASSLDGRIILRWIFRKWEGVVGTGWSWLRIRTGGGRL